MGMSATVIGKALNKTGREMNELLVDLGYLEGSPGDFSLTDKGKEYGSETEHHRGNGGYAHYNRVWETRTWDERIVTALADDMAAGTPTTNIDSEPVGEADRNDNTEQKNGTEQESGGTGRPVWAVAALVGGAAVAVVGGVVVATNPRVHRWVGENITPRAQKAWHTLSGRGPVETIADHDDDAPSGAVELAESTDRQNQDENA